MPEPRPQPCDICEIYAAVARCYIEGPPFDRPPWVLDLCDLDAFGPYIRVVGVW